MLIENVNDHYNTVLNAIKENMKFSQQAWVESHKGGELSRYSNFPELNWQLDQMDAVMMGWEAGDNQTVIRMVTDDDDTFVIFGTGWEYNEADHPMLCDELAEKWLDESQKETLLQHATKVLDHMWCASYGKLNASQASDWEVFKHKMRPQWSKPLLRTMLLIAGMISCGIGLSAGVWTNKHFVPVYVRLKDAMVIGLLARHARVAPDERTKIQYRCCVGRHRPDNRMNAGKDLILADPETGSPIGLIPDFLPDYEYESWTNKLYCERILALYKFSVEVEDNRVGFLYPPLSKLTKNITPVVEQTTGSGDGLELGMQ
jgi:hypothetical protein